MIKIRKNKSKEPLEKPPEFGSQVIPQHDQKLQYISNKHSKPFQMGSQDSSLVDQKMIAKKQTPIRATQKMQDPLSLQISGNNPILKNTTVIEEEKECSDHEFTNKTQ